LIRSFFFLLQKYLHDYPRIGAIIPEAAMMILVGMTAGLFIFLFGPGDEILDENQSETKYYDQYGQEIVIEGDEQENTDSLANSLLSFSPTVFFVVLLPPIIYNSGYHVQKDLFFRHLTPIAMYAFVGTGICTVVVASLLFGCAWLYPAMNCSFLELMTFGALISATGKD
jgi:hypothetical protein